MSTKTGETDPGNTGASDHHGIPAGMHKPAHGPLDTIETTALDEVLHDSALRDSTLRVPR
ncbi:hypothetical protein [Dyella psychrodurans]|uniref:Uncharacterized protein n=1 Tax=Dyella psychrodurans TaxID=1927960 RepID=A0A370WZG9_9GAMM|nr:hypothetical protein [Dyella psychrodurans]RDS81397.1 hypothetical protein DWU99_17130 [Dyella psychrodurans]